MTFAKITVDVVHFTLDRFDQCLGAIFETALIYKRVWSDVQSKCETSGERQNGRVPLVC
jgi:hypothetical protein